MMLVEGIPEGFPVKQGIERGSAAKTLFLGAGSFGHAAACMKGVGEVQHSYLRLRILLMQFHSCLKATVSGNANMHFPILRPVKIGVIILIEYRGILLG